MTDTSKKILRHDISDKEDGLMRIQTAFEPWGKTYPVSVQKILDNVRFEITQMQKDLSVESDK